MIVSLGTVFNSEGTGKKKKDQKGCCPIFLASLVRPRKWFLSASERSQPGWSASGGAALLYFGSKEPSNSPAPQEVGTKL